MRLTYRSGRSNWTLRSGIRQRPSAKKNRRKVAFPPAKNQVRSERSELVVHESAEDRRVVVDLSACNEAAEASGGGDGSREAGVAEVGIEIFGADGPVVGECVFNARPDCPADSRAAGVAAQSQSLRRVEDAEIRAGAGVRDAARSIEHQTIVRRDDVADFRAG